MIKYYFGILISLLSFNELSAKNIDIQENIDLSFKCELEKKIIKNSEYNYQVFLAKDLNDKNLFFNFLFYPLLTFKVIFGIHFQALLLWLKNIKYVKHKHSKYKKISYNNEYKLKDD